MYVVPPVYNCFSLLIHAIGGGLLFPICFSCVGFSQLDRGLDFKFGIGASLALSLAVLAKVEGLLVNRVVLANVTILSRS